MKKLTIKLLLSALVLTNAGSILAMATQLPAEVQAMQALYLFPDQVDFAKAKELINAIPADRINKIDTFVNGNLLYLLNSRYNQFKDTRYLELINLLKSKGAVAKEYKTSYIHDETNQVLPVNPETDELMDTAAPDFRAQAPFPAGLYTNPDTGRKIEFDPATNKITPLKQKIQ